MSTPEVAFVSLQATLASLELKFLSRHLVRESLSPMSEQDALDVDAYVVLSHAALEEFFELTALWVLDQAVEAWTLKGQLKLSLPTLVLHGSARGEIDESNPSRAFERVRDALVKIKKEFSRQVSDNHGISLKYLMKMFYPLGVDITSDPVLLGSLDTLARHRGSIAHKAQKGVNRHRSPHDVQKQVLDCLFIAEDVKNKSLAL